MLRWAKGTGAGAALYQCPLVCGASYAEASSWFYTNLSRRGGVSVPEGRPSSDGNEQEYVWHLRANSSPSAQCFISNICQFCLEFPRRIEQ